MNNQIRSRYYRVSAKALVLNEARDAFLITKDTVADKNGRWDVPGGGLDWGESPQTGIQREIEEEMGLETVWIADYPSYFVTHTSELNPELWICNVLFETKLKSFDFTPSEECTDIAWLGPANSDEYQTFEIISKLLKQFDPKRHQ